MRFSLCSIILCTLIFSCTPCVAQLFWFESVLDDYDCGEDVIYRIDDCHPVHDISGIQEFPNGIWEDYFDCRDNNGGSDNCPPQIIAQPGSTLIFPNGMGILIRGTQQFLFRGTKEDTITIYFDEDQNHLCGGIVSRDSRFHIPYIANTEHACAHYPLSVFKYCKFICRSSAPNLGTIVDISDMLKVQFEDCVFENANIGIKCSNMIFPQSGENHCMGALDWAGNEMLFFVNKCTFQDVRVGIAANNFRDYAYDCSYFPGPVYTQQSLALGILNSVFNIRTNGTGIELQDIFLDRFDWYWPGRDVGRFPNVFLIEGNLIRGVNIGDLVYGVYANNINVTTRFQKHLAIDNNFIDNASQDAISLHVCNRQTCGAAGEVRSCYPDTLLVSGNIIRESSNSGARSILIEQLSSVDDGTDVVAIGSNAMVNAQGGAGTVEGPHLTFGTSISELPEGYTDNDSDNHFGLYPLGWTIGGVI
jgi:hypothetical protein